MSTHPCPLCAHENDPSSYLGTLGNSPSYRCRACGATFQEETPPPNGPTDSDLNDDEVGEDGDEVEDLCHVCGEPATDWTVTDQPICADCRDADSEPDDPRDFPNPEVY